MVVFLSWDDDTSQGRVWGKGLFLFEHIVLVVCFPCKRKVWRGVGNLDLELRDEIRNSMGSHLKDTFLREWLQSAPWIYRRESCWWPRRVCLAGRWEEVRSLEWDMETARDEEMESASVDSSLKRSYCCCVLRLGPWVLNILGKWFTMELQPAEDIFIFKGNRLLNYY